jgi:glycosyltransferase involved in cell wall biosynthesis
MRILRIVSSGWPEGGVENGIVAMQPVYESLGHEVRTLASDSRPEQPHFNAYSFKEIAPGSPMRHMRRFVNIDACRSLHAAVSDFRPDVIHIHTLSQLSASIFLATGKTPSVLTVHGPEPCFRGLLKYCLSPNAFIGGDYESGPLNAKGRLQWIYMRYLIHPPFRTAIKRVNKVVALSSFMQNLLKQEGIEAAYVPNGIELPIDRDNSTADSHKPDRRRLLYAGRLEPYKGVEYLIQALPSIRQETMNAELVIAGDGSYRLALQKMAQDIGVGDSVKFRGRLKEDELKAEYRDCDIFVMPSTWPEAFGKTGVEALAWGKPVIGTGLGGMSDWLHDGKNGCIVPPGDANAIAFEVIRLLTNDALYDEIASNTRGVALDFSVESHVKGMLDIYQAQIDAKRN